MRHICRLRLGNSHRAYLCIKNSFLIKLYIIFLIESSLLVKTVNRSKCKNMRFNIFEFFPGVNKNKYSQFDFLKNLWWQRKFWYFLILIQWYLHFRKSLVETANNNIEKHARRKEETHLFGIHKFLKIYFSKSKIADICVSLIIRNSIKNNTRK